VGVSLGDGAVWIWNIGDEFPGAMQIVDIRHARQHIWNVSAKRFSSDDMERKRWAKRSGS
jgi:hypothetical protein